MLKYKFVLKQYVENRLIQINKKINKLAKEYALMN